MSRRIDLCDTANGRPYSVLDSVPDTPEGRARARQWIGARRLHWYDYADGDGGIAIAVAPGADPDGLDGPAAILVEEDDS